MNGDVQMQKLFFTGIKTYAECPLQYKYTYIDRIKNDKLTLKRDDGRIIHKMLEELSVDPTFEGLDKAINNTFMSFAKDYPFDQIKQCEKVLRSWFTADSFPHRVVEAEKRFLIPIKDTFMLSGVIDRIDEILPDKYNIIDYKTGNHLYGLTDIENSLQLRIYAYAAFHLYPFLTSLMITYVNVRLKNDISIEINKEQLGEMEENLFNFLSGLFLVPQKDFKAFVGQHCIYCPHTNICHPYKAWINDDMHLKEDMTVEEIADVYIWTNAKANTFRIRRGEMKDLLATILRSQGIDRLERDGHTIIMPQGSTNELRVIKRGLDG